MRFSTPTQQRPNGKRASVLMFTVIVMVSTGVAAVSWLQYLSHSQRASRRDRARVPALNAAESGVEKVIDFFNNPDGYTGTVPAEYDETMEASPYTVTYSYRTVSGAIQQKTVAKPGSDENKYDLFEPYILDILKDPEGIPVDKAGNVLVDASGDFLEGKKPVVTKSIFLRSEADNTSSKVPSFEIDPSEYAILKLGDTDGAILGEAIDLIFLHPQDFALYGDSAPPADKRVVGKIISRGRGDLKVEATVEQLLTENNVLQINSPGAIISHVDADMGAQFNVYWGGVFAKEDIILPAMNGNNKPNDSVIDPYLRIYTEGTIRIGNDYADGEARKGSSNQPITSDAENYYQPYLESASFEDYLHLKQHQQDLPLQKYDYNEWKRFFIANDLPYYYTTTDGKIWGRERDEASPDYGKTVSKTYSEWFDVSPTSTEYWEMDGLFAFIDSVPVNDLGETITVDGVPLIDDQYYPREPGTADAVMATISHSGGGDHTRGFILAAANLDFSGSGNPPKADVLVDKDGEKYFLNPKEEIPTSNEISALGYNGPLRISHNGVLYTWGTFNLTGNRVFYGSLIAEGGYSGNGTPDVFYNYRLSTGDFLNINQSFVKRDAWALRTKELPQIGG